MKPLSGVVFRGEPDGVLRERGGWLRPWFFAESFRHAESYARGGSPVCCTIQGSRVLDLTEPDFRNPEHLRLNDLMKAEFPEWIDRQSGEEKSFWDYLECADLYLYESGGDAERWNKMFQLAIEEMGYDAVRAMDCTDGSNWQPTPVWVTFNRESIRMATTGETLAQMLKESSWSEIERFLERDHPGLKDRISRLRIPDEDYRLDRAAVHQPIGLEESEVRLVSIYRGLPQGAAIRPGDWVALDHSYAGQHVRNASQEQVVEMEAVASTDIFWAGTDQNEFFYLPAAWRFEASSDEEYLRQLSPERIRMLCDGEESNINRHREQIQAITDKVLEEFDEDACGVYHGPDHWRRVAAHGRAVARSLGIDPLVPHIFGWVHDSQREDEGLDPEHGPRAAEFITENRDTLFSFLDDAQIAHLARACRLHSDGHTQDDVMVQACWDGDRLDLWRVGIEPDPRLLCTAYAKRDTTIENAVSFMERSQAFISRRSFREHF